MAEKHEARDDIKAGDGVADHSAHMKWWVLFVLTSIYTLNLLDRQLLPILQQPIKTEFDLSDTQLGLLSGIVFALFYMTVAVPIAVLADRYNRVKIIAVSCMLWSAFTAATGACANAMQLTFARIGVGIGEAGGSAPSFSILSDYFPPHRRSFAMAIFNLGFPIGVGGGIALAGTIGAAWGWRYTFYAAAVPGIFLAALLLMTVPEPIRGRLDVAPAKPVAGGTLKRSLMAFRQSAVLCRTTFASMLAATAFLAVSIWTPSYLIRTRGMSLSEIGSYYSISSAVSIALGLWLGGMFADRLVRKSGPAYSANVPAMGLLVAAPSLYLALQIEDWRLALPMLMIPTLFGAFYIGPSMGLMQNAAAPQDRATVSALYLFCANVCGQGLGPIIVGGISDHYSPAIGTLSLKIGLLAVVPLYLMAVAAYVWTGRALADEERRKTSVAR